MNSCLNCNQPTDNPKFCTKSCSTTFTNKNNPRIKKGTYFCSNCNKQIESYRAKFCKTCKDVILSGLDFTLEQALYTKHGKSSSYALIRTRARSLINKLRIKKECVVCNYSKHIEVCHIKSVNSYPKETLISIINNPSNLTILCPNCHWELDHKLLEKKVKTVKELIDCNILEEKPKINIKSIFYKKNKRKLEEIECLYCKNLFVKTNKTQKYCCYKCSHTASRKTNRPTKEQLEQELKESNFLALGRKYGVSDNAIRKWAKSYGII